MSVQHYRWAWRQKLEPAEKVSAAAAKVVLLCLVEFADREGWAWPAVETIAELTSLDQRTVRRALAALVSQGIVISNTRHRATTRYRVGVLRTGGPDDSEASAHPKSTRQHRHSAQAEDGHHAHPEPRHDAQANAADQPGHGVPDAWAPCPPSLGMVAPQPGHHAPRSHQEPTIEPTIEPLRASRARANSEPPDPFEEWWKEYPRKVQKDAARKEYAAALKRGATCADLLMALRRQQWPEEARFIVYPERWLKRGSWQDDPTAAAAPKPKSALEQWCEEAQNEDSEYGRAIRAAFPSRMPEAPTQAFDFDGEAEEVR